MITCVNNYRLLCKTSTCTESSSTEPLLILEIREHLMTNFLRTIQKSIPTIKMFIMFRNRTEEKKMLSFFKSSWQISKQAFFLFFLPCRLLQSKLLYFNKIAVSNSEEPDTVDRYQWAEYPL